MASRSVVPEQASVLPSKIVPDEILHFVLYRFSSGYSMVLFPSPVVTSIRRMHFSNLPPKISIRALCS